MSASLFFLGGRRKKDRMVLVLHLSNLYGIWFVVHSLHSKIRLLAAAVGTAGTVIEQ
jgi:hypothetical protein